MYTISRQSRFKKNVKLAEKRCKDLQKLKEVLLILIDGEELDPKYKDHQLIGNYANTKECHIGCGKKVVIPARPYLKINKNDLIKIFDLITKNIK